MRPRQLLRRWMGRSRGANEGVRQCQACPCWAVRTEVGGIGVGAVHQDGELLPKGNAGDCLPGVALSEVGEPVGEFRSVAAGRLWMSQIRSRWLRPPRR